MVKIFEQFHISLIERDQQDLLTVQLSREDWLRKQFGQRIKFLHQGKDFYWVPRELSDEFIFAIVERKRDKLQHFGPDEGAEEFTGEEWQGSYVVIDPMHRPGGQKLAFENDPVVGKPSSILKSLFSFLNENDRKQYSIQYNSIMREGSFEKFSEKHGNILRYVNFHFTVPNMIFGANTATVEGLKRIGKDTGADEVVVRMESEDGVRTDNDTIKEAVEYAEDGNARVSAKSHNGELWTSAKQGLRTKVQNIADLASKKKGEIDNWFRKVLSQDEIDSDNDVDNSNGSSSVG